MSLLLICVPLWVFSEDHPDGWMRQEQSEWQCKLLLVTCYIQDEVNLPNAGWSVGMGGILKRSGHSTVFPGRREILSSS